MTQRKKPVPNPIAINGYDLLWTLIRDTQWVSEDDHQGITISVRKAGPERRELILKFPYLGIRPHGKWHIPDRPKITTQIVQDAIRAGMKAGWDPDDRGKPVMVDVPEDAPQR